MRKRPEWQAEKARTAKALRELPKCELCGIKSGMGINFEGRWLCGTCAAQRARREKR